MYASIYIYLLEKYPQMEFLDQNLSAFPLFSPNCVNYNLDQFSQYDELCLTTVRVVELNQYKMIDWG